MRPQAAAMKALLNEPALQVMPGCGDAMGAHLIQEQASARFRLRSSISAMRLAMPDVDQLTFPDMRDAVEGMIAAAPNVLWLADGDTGYGNALSVQKTIRTYARAGAAAVLIEDKICRVRWGTRGRSSWWNATRRCCAAGPRWPPAARRGSCCWPAPMRAPRAGSRRRWRGSAISWPKGPTSCSSIHAVGSRDACVGRGLRGPSGDRGQRAGGAALHAGGRGTRADRHPAGRVSAGGAGGDGARRARGPAGLKGGPKPPMAGGADLASAIRLPEYLALDQRLADR